VPQPTLKAEQLPSKEKGANAQQETLTGAKSFDLRKGHE